MKIGKKGSHKLLRLLVSASLMLSVSGTALADDLEEQLEDLQRQAEQQQQITSEANERVANFSEALRVVQEQLKEATASYNEVKGQLDEVQEKIDSNTVLLESTEKSLKERNLKLQARVRDIYINGQISYVDVLFGAKDFSDLVTRMDVLKRIIKHDYDLIQQVKEDKKVIMQAREQLEQDKEVAEKLVLDAQMKRESMEEMEYEQRALLDRAIYDRDTSEQVYQELMTASEEIASMIRRSSGAYGYSGATPGAGGMIWPLNGPITSEFGWRTHPIFGTSRFHSGMDIGGDYGMPIYAAAGGTVTYSGWISGYGNTIIIDHGGGVSTLYGHNDSLVVGEGEIVAQGQVVALCGSTGNSTGPHCHFEVREGGEPVSPYGYL